MDTKDKKQKVEKEEQEATSSREQQEEGGINSFHWDIYRIFAHSMSNQDTIIAELENLLDAAAASMDEASASSFDSEYLVEEPLMLEKEQVTTEKEEEEEETGSPQKRPAFEYRYTHRVFAMPGDATPGGSVVRSISLSRWPEVGFGFKVSEAESPKSPASKFMYVSELAEPSPAEACLRLGDILIEIDERDPCDARFFESVHAIDKYLRERENLHLMVIDESNYFQCLQKEPEELKSFVTNCEDIVIASWHELMQSYSVPTKE